MAETKTTRTTLNTGDTSSDPVQAYLDARTAQSGIRTNWDVASDISSDVLGGIQLHREEVEIEEKRRKTELEGYENEFSSNVDKINESAGSLGEEYYGLATEQAKLMQEEYMKAVQEGDKETQSKLKMKLQGLSTSVQTLKEGLNIAAELKNDEALSNGRTALEKEISAVCTNPANIVYEEGEWKWKNPKFNPEIEGSKQFFTQEDLTNSLGQKDQVTKAAYIDWRDKKNLEGGNYVNGVEGAADFERGRIKTSVSDEFITQDNIMSIMHDDFGGHGMSHTFAADLGKYLDSMGDKLYEGLKIDANGDGVFTPDDWDSPADKKKIIEAITNKDSKIMGRNGKMIPLYKYETSKDIVAEYLTMQAEDKFYGDSKKFGKTLQERKDMVPEKAESLDTFIKRGGIAGGLAKKGIIWNSDSSSWENPKWDNESLDAEYEKSLKE